MASSTYLTLTNKLLARFNENLLNQATFGAASGVQLLAAQAINNACTDIYQQNWLWPFNYVEGDTSNTITLTAGVQFYAYPTTSAAVPGAIAGQLAEDIDLNNIYILQNLTFNPVVNAVQLQRISHDKWKRYWEEIDLNATVSTSWALPVYCFDRPSLSLGISPIPDKAYQINVPYWFIPTDLVAWNDTPTIPTRFDDVIVTGGAMFMHDLRKNIEQMDRASKMYQDGVKRMRKLMINTYDSFESTSVDRW